MTYKTVGEAVTGAKNFLLRKAFAYNLPDADSICIISAETMDGAHKGEFTLATPAVVEPSAVIMTVRLGFRLIEGPAAASADPAGWTLVDTSHDG